MFNSDIRSVNINRWTAPSCAPFSPSPAKATSRRLRRDCVSRSRQSACRSEPAGNAGRRAFFADIARPPADARRRSAAAPCRARARRRLRYPARRCCAASRGERDAAHRHHSRSRVSAPRQVSAATRGNASAHRDLAEARHVGLGTGARAVARARCRLLHRRSRRRRHARRRTLSGRASHAVHLSHVRARRLAQPREQGQAQLGGARQAAVDLDAAPSPRTTGSCRASSARRAGCP